uniref:Myosin II heavy chain n=1 Tax=Clandestinovirus TaxID=2831644 RepID=A0A8F8PR56_9VIRU|nr:myosin II heavy chain [Clandestinovirus]
MDQTVTRKDTTVVSQTITSEPQTYQPIVKSSYLRPKFGLNNIKSKDALLRSRLGRSQVQSKAQTTDQNQNEEGQVDKTVESKPIEVAGSTVDAFQRRYGKYGNFVAKLARKGLIAPRRTGKANIQAGITAKTDKVEVSTKPKYNKIQLQLLKRGIVPRTTVRKLDTKTIETYQEYLSLKSELLVADDARKIVLNDQLFKLESANSQLLQVLGGAEFDDIKDGIFKGYQDVLSEMSTEMGKTLSQSQYDGYVKKVSGLNRQIDGLVEKVKSQQTNSVQWEAGLAMIDKRLSTLFSALVNEQDPGKKAAMQMEMNELDTKFKPMFKQLIASAQQDLLKWTNDIESIKTLQSQFNKSFSAAYNGERIVSSKLMQAVNNLSDMFRQVSNVGSIIVNQQMVSLWFNESAIDFMSAWSSYKFLNDPNNLDNEQVRNYMIAQRATLPSIKAKVSGFAAKMSMAGMDFHNLDKKYQTLSDGFRNSTKRIDALRAEITEIQSSISTLTTLSEQSRVKIGNATLTKAQLEVKLAQLSGQIFMLETDMGISARKQNSFNNEVNTLESLKAKVDALELQTAKIGGFFKQNDAIIPTLRVVNEMMKVAKEFKDTAEQVNKQVAEEKQQQLKQNADDLKVKEEEAKKLQEATDELERKNAQLAAERVAEEALLAEKQEMLKQLQATQKDTEANLKQLQTEVELQGQKVISATKEQSELAGKIDENKKALTQLSADVEDKQKQAALLDKDAKQLQGEIEALKIAQNMENANLGNITRQINQQMQKLTNLTANNQELEQQRLQLENVYRIKEQEEIAKLEIRLQTEEANIIQKAVAAKEKELQAQMAELQKKLVANVSQSSAEMQEAQTKLQQLMQNQASLLAAAEQKVRTELANVHAAEMQTLRGKVQAELEAEVTKRVTDQLTQQNKKVEASLLKQQQDFEKAKQDFENAIRTQATNAEKERLTKEFELVSNKHEQDKLALAGEIQSLKNQLSELDTLKEENEALKANVQFFADQLDTARSFIGQQQKDIQALQQNLDEKQKVLNAVNDDLKKAKDEQTRLQNTVTALQQDLETANQTIENQKIELGKATNALSEQTRLYTELQAQKAQVDEQLQTANAKITQFEQTITEQKSEVDRLKSEANARQTELDGVNKKNADLQTLVSKNEQEIGKLSEDKNKIESRLKSIREQLGAAQAENDEEFVKRLQEREKRQMNALAEQENAIKSLTDKTKGLQDELAKSQEKAANLATELDNATKQITSLNTTIASQKAEISTLQKNVADLEQKNASLQDENVKLSTQVGELTNQNKILNGQKEALEKDVARLESDIKAKDDLIDKQKQELAEKTDRINALEKEVDDLKSENKQLREENAILQNKLQVEQEGRRDLAKILGPNHSEDWKDIQESVKNLKLSNESQSTMLQALAPLLLSKSGNKFTANDVKAKVEELAKLVDEFKQDDTEDVFMVINRVFATTTDQKAELAKQKTKIDEQLEEIESLKQKDQEAAAKIAELQTQLGEVTKAKEQATKQLDELRDDYDDLQSDFDRVNRRKLELERQHDKIYEDTMKSLDEAIKLGDSLKDDMMKLLEDIEFYAEAQNVSEYKALVKKIKTIQLPYMERYLKEWNTMKTKYQRQKDEKGNLVIPKDFMEKNVVQQVLDIKNVLNDTFTLTLRNSQRNYDEAKRTILEREQKKLEDEQTQLKQQMQIQQQQMQEKDKMVDQLQMQVQQVNDMNKALANANQYYDEEVKAIKVAENESMVNKKAALNGIIGWLEQIPELAKGQSNVKFDKRSNGTYDLVNMEKFAKSLNAESHTVILNISEPILQWLGSHQYVHNFNIRHRKTVMWLVTMHILKYAGVKKIPSPSVIMEDIKQMMYSVVNTTETATIQSKLEAMSKEMETNLGLAGAGGNLIRSYFKENYAMVVQADVFDVSKKEKANLIQKLKDLMQKRTQLPQELSKSEAQELKQARDEVVKSFMDKWKGTSSSSADEADTLLTQNLDILINNPDSFGPNPDHWFEKLTYSVVQSQVLNPMEEAKLMLKKHNAGIANAVKKLLGK